MPQIDRSGICRGVFVFALIIAAILFLGCGSMKKGTVIGKKFEPYNEYIIMQPVYTTQCTTGANGYSSCQQVLVGMFPHIVEDDEDYILRLRDCPSAANDGGERECREGNAYVSASVYRNFSVGDHFDAEKTPGSFDDQNPKRRKQ